MIKKKTTTGQSRKKEEREWVGVKLGEKKKETKKRKKEREREGGGKRYTHTLIKQLTKKLLERVTQTERRHTDRHLEYFNPFFFHM